MSCSLLSFFLLMVCSFMVRAEGRCPAGYAPTTNPDFVGCAPIYGSEGYDSGYSPASPSKPPDPGPRWDFRWGAIVVDAKNGIFGGADGFKRPSQALEAAVKDCRKHGGKQCEVAMEYYNQCAALVWGDNKLSAHSGPQPEELKERALGYCNNETSNCKIYYMGCSYPVEIE